MGRTGLGGDGWMVLTRCDVVGAGAGADAAAGSGGDGEGGGGGAGGGAGGVDAAATCLPILEENGRTVVIDVVGRRSSAVVASSAIFVGAGEGRRREGGGEGEGGGGVEGEGSGGGGEGTERVKVVGVGWLSCDWERAMFGSPLLCCRVVPPVAFGWLPGVRSSLEIPVWRRGLAGRQRLCSGCEMRTTKSSAVYLYISKGLQSSWLQWPSSRRELSHTPRITETFMITDAFQNRILQR